MTSKDMIDTLRKARYLLYSNSTVSEPAIKEAGEHITKAIRVLEDENLKGRE